jgi:glycosyltransferase involved in cell wall biosynthesis
MLDGSPTSKLVRQLLRRLEPEIRSGKVILGVETQAMKQAAERVFGVPFTYFPHPVQAEKAEIQKRKAEIAKSKIVSPSAFSLQPSALLTMACYGPARHEKGSDLLAAAIEKYLERFPDSRARFVLQWLTDFSLPSGGMAQLPAALRQHPRVEIVDRYFAEGEYAQRLAGTQVLLLPYRCSSYALRVSRVVIEAMVNGLPVVATRGTTLAEQAEQFGAAVLCEDENVESLVAAIETVERNYEALAAKASGRQGTARGHFSVRMFRETLISKAEKLKS